jgi:hypothetical protein
MGKSGAASPARSSAVRTAQPAVPFITKWSGEHQSVDVVFRRGARSLGIGYPDERSYDRDEHGVLWARDPSQPGKGRPQFGAVHALRQRMCMSGLRCQVCGGPADRTADGVLWLIDAEPHELDPAREVTAHPPVCRPCAHWSVHACPHLRKATTPLRVRSWAPYGVKGILHRPVRHGHEHGYEAVDAMVFPYNDPRLPWVQAGQLVLALSDFTVVALDAGLG